MTRAGKPHVTRRALLDAARDVYNERGYDGTSVNLVARRANLTTGAVYANFESKDDLLMTLLEERAEELIVSLEAQLRGCTTVAERIDVLLDWYGNRFERDRIGGRLTFDLVRQSYDNPAVRARIAKVYQRGRALAGAALTTELSAHGIEPPLPADALAGLAIALVDGIMVQQLVFGGNGVLDDLRTALVKLGVLPEKPLEA